jgi:hypothetical protein
MSKETKKTAGKGRGILAEIEAVERMLKAVGDEEIADEAKELADAEEGIVSESTDDEVSIPEEDILDENERAMKNWPIEARKKFAAKLLRLASAIIAEDDEEAEKESEEKDEE